MSDNKLRFTLIRDLDATPAEVFAAWTEPDQIAAWWHPQGMRTPRDGVSVDLRVGGAYTYTMVGDGSEHPTGGVYREILPNERLVFTWGVPGDEDAPVVTLTLEELAGRTRLVFELRGVEGKPGDGSYHDGWVSALDVLSSYLAPSRAAR